MLAALASASPKAVEPVAPISALSPLTPAVPLVVPKLIPAAEFKEPTISIPARFPSDSAPPKLGEWATVAVSQPSVAFDGARTQEGVLSPRAESKDSSLGPRLAAPVKRGYGVPLRVAAAASLSVAALVPIAKGEAPPTALAYGLAAAWTLALGLELLYRTYRAGRWIVRRGKAPERRWLGPATAVAVGLGLGAAIGGASSRAPGPVVEKAASVLAPELGVRDAGTALSEEALALLAANPAAAKTAERLRGLKAPEVFVAARSELPLRYEPRIHALLVSPKALAERGWTADAFVRSPELQRRLARELEADAARELFRMSQARANPLYDGNNLDGGPIEAEQEALLFEHDYVHARLLADPHAPLDPAALSRYETMLGSFKAGLREHDGLAEVSRRGYWNAGHYRGLFMHREFNWPEHAVEGYMLLARRAKTIGERADYLFLASDLAAREGVRFKKPLP